MSPQQPIDELMRTIQSLDRQDCKAQLLHFERVKLDFTETCLDQMSTERMRHVLMAAWLQAGKTRRR